MRYIPVIYSGKVMADYRARTVLTKVTNTDYEGEIKKYGDAVWIRSDPVITVRDYRKGQNLVNEQPESTAQQLLIDHGKYWSFVSFSLDNVQTDLKGCLSRWADSGSFEITKAIDPEVFAAMIAGASSDNCGDTAGITSNDIELGVATSGRAVTKSNILELLVDCGTVLDEQNVPEEGRFMLITPRMAGLISKSDLKDCSLTGDSTSVIRNGRLGNIARFELFQTNLMPTTGLSSGEANVIFGNKAATTFATQLVESKIQDDPFGFGKLHRGLNVYGFKVVKSVGIGYAVAAIG
jgi:hypothetical protein